MLRPPFALGRRPGVFHRGAYRDVATVLDRLANAHARRRALPAGQPGPEDMDIDAGGLLADEYYRTLHGAPNRSVGSNDDDREDAP